MQQSILPMGNSLIKKSLSVAAGMFWKGLIKPMPPALVRSFARGLFSRSWKKFKAAAQDPAQAQLDQLMWTIRRNSGTQFGKEHEFDKIHSVEDFQKRVPISTYDDLEPYIQRMFNGEQNVLTADTVEYFAMTSGTTGAAKYIPITRPFLQEYQHGRRVWTRQVVLTFPEMVKGAVLTIRSTKISGRSPSGVPFGPISVALGNKDPAAAGPLKKLLAPVEAIPLSVFEVDDLESRYYLLLRIAVTTPVSIIAAINPSTIILICRKLNEFATDIIADCNNGGIRKGLKIDDDLLSSVEHLLGPCPEAAQRLARSMAAFGRVRPVDIWPELAGVLCWKAGSASFYLRQFSKYFEDLPVMDYCYAATEGNFTVAMDAYGNDGVLNSAGHFFEFIPEDSSETERPLCAHELAQGGRYRVLITSSNGLYRYDINDIVEITGFWHKAPRMVFLHKGGNILSFTGEKVSETHVTRAVESALSKTGLSISAYCASARMERQMPRYLFVVEPEANTDERLLKLFLKHLDISLMLANMEYESKRKSQRIAEPVLLLVGSGVFEKWTLRRISEGASDSRVKLPHLVKDFSVLEGLGPFEIIKMEGES